MEKFGTEEGPEQQHANAESQAKSEKANAGGLISHVHASQGNPGYTLLESKVKHDYKILNFLDEDKLGNNKRNQVQHVRGSQRRTHFKSLLALISLAPLTAKLA